MTEPVVESSVFDDSMHAKLRAARVASPTAIDAMTGAVVVLSYDEVEHLAHDPRVAGVGMSFFDFMGIGDTSLRRWYASLLFTNEGDPHHRLRRLVARAFTPRSVETHRALAAALTRQRLREVVEHGGGDLVRAFATVPISVICRLLGVPDDEVEVFLAYGDALSPVFGFMDPGQIDAAAAAVEGLLIEVDRMISERSARSGDDLISGLLEAEEEGDRLTHDELISMVGNLIVAGHDTTASQIGCTLLTLLRNPTGAAALRCDDVSAANVVTETMRIEPSIPLIPRTLTAPVEIGGTTRDAGSMVFLSSASANREERVWGDPDAFRPARFAEPGAPRLLSFGSGAHYCLGAALARMTLEEVAAGVVAANLESDADVDAVEWTQVLGRSPAALPVHT